MKPEEARPAGDGPEHPVTILAQNRRSAVRKSALRSRREAGGWDPHPGWGSGWVDFRAGRMNLTRRWRLRLVLRAVLARASMAVRKSSRSFTPAVLRLRYSYWSAWRTFSRLARRAGMTAAITPTIRSEERRVGKECR